MRLKDIVAIVTGGAHGMGEAEARLFATEGAKVVVADILEHEAEMVAADIRAGGQEAIAAKIDVTSESEWVGLIAKAMATYGKLDILVNNAGISGSSVSDPDGLWRAAIGSSLSTRPAKRPSRFSWKRISRNSRRSVGASLFSTFPATCLAKPVRARRDVPRSVVLLPLCDKRFRHQGWPAASALLSLTLNR